MDFRCRERGGQTGGRREGRIESDVWTGGIIGDRMGLGRVWVSARRERIECPRRLVKMRQVVLWSRVPVNWVCWASGCRKAQRLGRPVEFALPIRGLNDPRAGPLLRSRPSIGGFGVVWTVRTRTWHYHGCDHVCNCARMVAIRWCQRQIGYGVRPISNSRRDRMLRMKEIRTYGGVGKLPHVRSGRASRPDPARTDWRGSGVTSCPGFG